MESIEILAPAGSYESLEAAVRCGADAVYFGLDGFNARQNAKNFTLETLKDAVDYCHLYNTKVYLTLNTLVSDEEMSKAAKMIEGAAKCGVDAFIVQDLGIANLIKEIVPDAVLHASTQMSVQTLEGINHLHCLGFSRVVIPRELTKNEIKILCENSPIELEMFIHGAFCMSVSGQCYMSAMIGSRSGNRGLCAQPCRLPFKAIGGTGYDLSLKDNSLIEYIQELREMGIKSFKIEGRMKRPEYVAAAVTACRNFIDNDPLFSQNYGDLKNVFSRSGFTQGYYLNKLSKEMFGIRQKEDVVNSKKTIDKLAMLYKKDKSVYPVKFKIVLKENQKAILHAFASNSEVTVSSDFSVEKAINKPITFSVVENQLKKCGETAFYFDYLGADIDENVSVSLSQINQLRRSALDALKEKIIKRPKFDIKPYEEKNIQKHISLDEKYAYYCFNSQAQIPDSFDEKFDLFLPLHTDIKIFEKLKNDGYQIGAKMPRGIFGNSSEIKDKLEKLQNLKIKKIIAPTLDGIAIAKEFNFEICAGIGTNCFNSKTLEHFEKEKLEDVIVSFELTAKQIGSLGASIKRGVLIYGKPPVMLTRNCPIKNGGNCSDCKQNGFLTDRLANKFAVKCDTHSCEIFNPFPLYLLDKKESFANADFYVFEFTDESKNECEKIIENYKNATPAETEFTRGLYFRGVQ